MGVLVVVVVGFGIVVDIIGVIPYVVAIENSLL
jgi:hypothetical protein